MTEKKRRIEELQKKIYKNRDQGNSAAGNAEKFDECLKFFAKKVDECDELGDKEAEEIE